MLGVARRMISAARAIADVKPGVSVENSAAGPVGTRSRTSRRSSWTTWVASTTQRHNDTNPVGVLAHNDTNPIRVSLLCAVQSMCQPCVSDLFQRESRIREARRHVIAGGLAISHGRREYGTPVAECRRGCLKP